MAGGLGDDTYGVDSESDTVSEAAGEGARDVVYAGTNYALSDTAEIELMVAASPSGTEPLVLIGNGFNQAIFGNSGNNRLFGLGGTDELSGGGGADELFGGDGADLFSYSDVADTGLNFGTMDIVQDFSAAQGDRFDFSQMDADDTVAGSQDWTFVGRGPFTGVGQISIQDDGVYTYIVLENDGDLNTDAAIQVLGVFNVDASWFLL
jgi:Ca2+-binding RTX toxin-like protein